MPAPDIAAQRTLQIRNTARPPVCKWQVGGRRCAATRAKWGVLRCRVRSWAPPAASACRQRCQPSCHPVSKGSGATVKPSGTDQRTSLIPRLGAAPSSPSSPSPSCSPATSNAGRNAGRGERPLATQFLRALCSDAIYGTCQIRLPPPIVAPERG